MEHRNLIRGFFFVFTIFLVLPIVLADTGAATFKGNVTINSNASTTGANISAYISGIIKGSDTVGPDNCPGCPSGYSTAGFFAFDVPCSSGDVITFTVYNVTVNEATQVCSTWGSTFLNLSITTLAASAACSWSEACTGGYCCAGINEYRGNGTGACQATACSSNVTTTTTTTTSAGGGGGGGGRAAAEEESQTKYTGLIQGGDTKEVKYSKEDTLKVTGIEVTASKKVTNAAIKVTESSASAAETAISSDEGGSYKYLEITKSLISDDQIASARVYFKVEKSWYTDNDYDVDTTVLRRKVDDAWQDLITTKYKDDDTYYYFYADTPGLSYFAIVAQKKGYVPPVVEEAVCGDGVCEIDETCSSCVEDCGCAADSECINDVCTKKEVKEPVITPKKLVLSRAAWTWIGVGAVVLILIILALIRKKKK